MCSSDLVREDRISGPIVADDHRHFKSVSDRDRIRRQMRFELLCRHINGQAQRENEDDMQSQRLHWFRR